MVGGGVGRGVNERSTHAVLAPGAAVGGLPPVGPFTAGSRRAFRPKRAATACHKLLSVTTVYPLMPIGPKAPQLVIIKRKPNQLLWKVPREPDYVLVPVRALDERPLVVASFYDALQGRSCSRPKYAKRDTGKLIAVGRKEWNNRGRV